MSTHRPYLQRAAHILGAVGIAFALLAAAPVAESLRAVEPRATAPGSRVPLAPPSSGDLVARITVPRLALDAPVYEGVDSLTLAHGAGHLPGTALPGEEGGTNHTVVAVPRDTGAAGISELRVGETVTMRTPFGLRSYRVKSRRILPPDALEISPTRRPRVTIVTPYPADALGPAPMRLALVLERA
ncbi:MAG: class D sortase [Acidobacteriota bacterium]